LENTADLKTEIEVLKEKIKQQEKALIVQAEEYKRRLGELNNEAGRLANMQSSYVSKETYELQHRVLTDKLETLKSAIEKRPSWLIAGIISLLLMVLGILTGLALK